MASHTPKVLRWRRSRSFEQGYVPFSLAAAVRSLEPKTLRISGVFLLRGKMKKYAVALLCIEYVLFSLISDLRERLKFYHSVHKCINKNILQSLIKLEIRRLEEIIKNKKDTLSTIIIYIYIVFWLIIKPKIRITNWFCLMLAWIVQLSLDSNLTKIVINPKLVKSDFTEIWNHRLIIAIGALKRIIYVR